MGYTGHTKAAAMQRRSSFCWIHSPRARALLAHMHSKRFDSCAIDYPWGFSSYRCGYLSAGRDGPFTHTEGTNDVVVSVNVAS